MGWGAVDGQGSSGGGVAKENKLELVPGTSKKVRFLLPNNSEPYSVWTHYIPNFNPGVKAKGKIVYCPGMGVCPACGNPEFRTRLTHIVNVFDYSTNSVKILETGNMIMKQAKMLKDQFGTLDAVDIVINRTGAGTNTSYTIITLPVTANLPPDIQLFDLPSMYVTTSVEEVTKTMSDFGHLSAPVSAQGAVPIASAPMQQVIQKVMPPVPVAPPPTMAPVVTNVPPPVTNIPVPVTNIPVPVTVAPIPVPPQVVNTPPATAAPVGAPTTEQTNIVDFGKYKGKTLDEVATMDIEYLDWVANNVPKFKDAARKLYIATKAMGVQEAVAQPAPAAVPQPFIQELESEKAAANYKQQMASNTAVSPQVVNNIADNIEIQVIRIQKLISAKFAGNFQRVAEIMSTCSKSPTHPNGKIALAEFSPVELTQLEFHLNEEGKA